MKVIIALLFVATLAVARRGGRPEEGRGGHGGGHSGHKPNIADICAEVASNCPSGTQFRFFDGPCDQLPTSGRPGKPGRRENPCAAGTDSV